MMKPSSFPFSDNFVILCFLGIQEEAEVLMLVDAITFFTLVSTIAHLPLWCHIVPIFSTVPAVRANLKESIQVWTTWKIYSLMT